MHTRLFELMELFLAVVPTALTIGSFCWKFKATMCAYVLSSTIFIGFRASLKSYMLLERSSDVFILYNNSFYIEYSYVPDLI